MAPLLNAYEIAQAICALDSRLRGIELQDDEGLRRLIYRYEVAGQIEPFYVPLTDKPVDSIATLYPEAQRFETELQQRYGIEFVLRSIATA